MTGPEKRCKYNDLTQVINPLENQLANKRNQIMKVLILIIWNVLLFQTTKRVLITFTNDGAICCVSANLSEVDCRRRVLDFKVLKPRDCKKTEQNSTTFKFLNSISL